MNFPTCKTCLFCVTVIPPGGAPIDLSKVMRQCHLNPPQVLLDPRAPGKYQSAFPLVGPDSWCSKWVSAEVAKGNDNDIQQ